uniref:Uncharacterized protein n=1 Tax=Meloidogyne enterolobii TaxID=390850 RepID=A0A6V7XVE3_MELEN|nr:unnamed protein product [Meloidogyne enterolobii]
MRGLFSLCLCIFLISQMFFETAIAATCPGGYKTGKNVDLVVRQSVKTILALTK